MVMGLPAESITAAGTMLLALATVALAIPTIFLAIAAWKQLPLLRSQLKALGQQITDAQAAATQQAEAQRKAREAEEWRYIEANTLRACEKYFSNLVIHAATRKVFAGTYNGTKYDKATFKFQHELITVLNYLNGIGTGVEEGIFSGEIVKDHMPNTITKVVDVIIPALVDRPGDFQALINLRNNWTMPNPSYQKRPVG
jgi:hypothetical protein